MARVEDFAAPLLQDGLDGTKSFEEDHIFPKSVFMSKELARRGIAEEQIPEYLDAFNKLPNLELLVGTRSNEKLAMLPADWLQHHFTNDGDRQAYLRILYGRLVVGPQGLP